MTSYMSFEEINADVNSFNHVMEVCLKDERLSGMIQHPSSMLELLEILQVSANVFHHGQQAVLPKGTKMSVRFKGSWLESSYSLL